MLKWIERIELDEEAWTLGMELLKEKHAKIIKQNRSGRVHHEKEYDRVVEQLNGLVDMRADGELTKQEFLDQKKRLLKKQAQIESLIKDAKDSENNWIELTEEFLDTAHTARQVFLNGKPEEKRELLFRFGSNFLLNDKRIEVSIKKPFDALLKPQYRTNVLPG